jgi:hypothetical protein
MHFGKTVKGVAQSSGFSAEEFAVMLGRTAREILELYEQEEWTSGNIKAASIALEHDFGKYLNQSSVYDFLPSSNYRELLLTVRYPKGKDTILKSWLTKIKLIAKAIGLEVE